MTSCPVPRNMSLSHSGPDRGGRPACLFLPQDEAPPGLPSPDVIEAEALCTWGLRLCGDHLEFLNNFHFEFMSVSEVQRDSEAGAVSSPALWGRRLGSLSSPLPHDGCCPLPKVTTPII